ncbi:MAG: hypothetical protein EOO20_17050 [Chryseobacterium sp.]|nr:MAG: hypothetical protein EOO20_17050 [Chryseobacterium sp.]
MQKADGLQFKNNGNNISANWSLPNQEKAFQWVLFTKYGNDWRTQILNSDIQNMEIVKLYNNKMLNTIAIKAIDRLGNESDYKADKVK